MLDWEKNFSSLESSNNFSLSIFAAISVEFKVAELD